MTNKTTGYMPSFFTLGSGSHHVIKDDDTVIVCQGNHSRRIPILEAIEWMEGYYKTNPYPREHKSQYKLNWKIDAAEALFKFAEKYNNTQYAG